MEHKHAKTGKVLVFSLFMAVLSVSSIFAAETVLFKGKWGKETNQLGIVLPAPGVMPLAPYQCIGGFDVDNSGAVWFSDSVNNMLKCYKDRNWSYILVNFGRMGDLQIFNGKIHVVTREPDGVAVIDPDTGKVVRQIRIDFKNPGRIKVFSENTVAVEESGSGIWICRSDKVYQHPATALEAAGDSNSIFGLQYSFVDDSRMVIRAELADEVQEPDVFAVYEAGEKIIFSKTAGSKNGNPVIMTVVNSAPKTLKLIAYSAANQIGGTIELPVLDGPFLHGSWKICSDGNIYGFAGDANNGFSFLKSTKNL